MEYRSIAELNELLVEWTYRLPRDIDVVVGVPRSGLMVANLLALHLNLPMTDVEGLITGRLLRTGARFNGRRDLLHNGPCNVLVVDDSICSGAALREVKAQIRAARLPHRIRYAVAYVSPESVENEWIDLYGEVVPLPRVFEWNVLHTPLLASFCVDIDGVLCHDPLEEDNDDGRRYRRFLRCAEPLYLPRYEIGWLVTSRLEKYRTETAAWLAEHGVRYRNLVMMDYPDMAARRAAKAYASFKAELYVKSEAQLFIESAPHTAKEIADLADKPVFAMDTRQMLYPGSELRPRVPRLIVHNPVTFAIRRVARLPRSVAHRLSALVSTWTVPASGQNGGR